MLKYQVHALIITTLFLLTLPQVAGADGFAQVSTLSFIHEPWYPGARTGALGSADLATSRGPLAILNNPAAPQEGLTLQLGFQRSSLPHNLRMSQWAAAGEWKRLRLGIVRYEMALRDGIIRTAYNPEGTGETIDAVDRIWTTGMAVDVIPARWRDGGLSVMVGMNWRHYWQMVGSTETRGDDADLGLTAGWRHDLHDGWVSLTSAVMRHNLFDNEIEFGSRSYTLPSYTQIGATVTRCWFLPDHSSEAIRLLVAYSHQQEVRDEDRYRFHADRWGIELTAMETITFRWGDNDDPFANGVSERTGLGLTIPRRLINPWQLQLDWTHLDTGNLGGWQDVFGMTVAVNF